jgi:hypothetical protein
MEAGPEETIALVGIILLIAVTVSVLASLGTLLARHFNRQSLWHSITSIRRAGMLHPLGFVFLIVVAVLLYALFDEPNLDLE